MSKFKKNTKEKTSTLQENPVAPANGFAERFKSAVRNISHHKWRVAVVLAVVVAAGAVYFSGVLKGDADSEASAIIAKVRNHMLLPDEAPTIATIQKVDELKKENNFYANAKNEDRLLVFTNARLAVIYSDETDKIINVGPILTKSSEPAND